MKNKPCLLFVEGNPHLRDVTEELLTLEGYDCVYSSDGLEALSIIRERSIDLVITELDTPSIGGAILLFCIRHLGHHMPIVFTTSRKERLPLEEIALEDCCVSMLQKPISFDELSSEIQKAKNRQHEFMCRGKVYHLGAIEKTKPFSGYHWF